MTGRFDITFTIRRADVEIGFGASSPSETITEALYEVDSIIQNELWETEPGMPDPEDFR